jgi:MYXO-CTERM domain-containing protein
MGLFDPKGAIAKATLAGLDAHLAAPAGAGWSRNDDRFDHAGKDDVSPWGSEYDSAEWVVTDLRGAVAMHRAGDDARSDRLLRWVRDQSLANYLAVSETYDEGTGVYKFNAPMVGFGAGVYALALVERSREADPACGAYYDESASTGAGGASSSSTGGGGASAGAGGSDARASSDEAGGCGCRLAGGSPSGAWVAALALALTFARRRRRAQ